jgi:hypothetical protein
MVSVSSRQQPEVTPFVPFKNKIQYYQPKQPFLSLLQQHNLDNFLNKIIEICVRKKSSYVIGFEKDKFFQEPSQTLRKVDS